jgi:D-alanyl-D-alanine carboxypeptidase
MDKRIFALIALICIGALAFSIFTPKEGKIFIFPVASAKSKEEVKGVKEEKLSSAYKYTRILSFPWDQSFSFTNPQNYLDLSKELPYVRAKNAISVNLNKNTILFSREEHRPVPIASVTKIMTATIALEHKKLTDKIKVSKKAATVGENAMGISEGETYTLEDLLYGLILHSGNDAAVTIAEGVAGTEENFVFYMNSKAKELGLNETTYADSNGLNDGNVSSAYDQAKLTKYAPQK